MNAFQYNQNFILRTFLERLAILNNQSHVALRIWSKQSTNVLRPSLCIAIRFRYHDSQFCSI